jgi:hypothetical protein
MVQLCQNIGMFSRIGSVFHKIFRAARTGVEGLLRSLIFGWRHSGGVHTIGLHWFFVGLSLPIAFGLMTLGLVLDLFSSQRPLTTHEQALALRIFGPKFKLHLVRVTTHSWLLDLLHRINGARPFVTMYSIHACRGNEMSASTLVHELTHVWQAQKEGPLYLVHALAAQWGAAWREWFKHRRFDDHSAYLFTDEQLDAHGGELKRFNHEQQACIMAAYCEYLLQIGAPITAHRAKWLERYALCVR